MTETSTSADTMKISFCVLGEIKVDYDVDGLDIDTAGKEICTDEVATDTLTEVVEDSVTVCLKHFGV